MFAAAFLNEFIIDLCYIDVATWSSLGSAGFSGRRRLSSVYDSSNGLIYSTGGTPDGTVVLSDLWQYNPTTCKLAYKVILYFITLFYCYFFKKFRMLCLASAVAASQLASMSTARRGHSMLINPYVDAITVIGGYGSAYLSDIVTYQVASSKLSTYAVLSLPKFHLFNSFNYPCAFYCVYRYLVAKLCIGWFYQSSIS